MTDGETLRKKIMTDGEALWKEEKAWHRLGQWLHWHGWWRRRGTRRLFYYLWRGHDFRLFKPEWIARAFSSDVKPLFGGKAVGNGEKDQA